MSGDVQVIRIDDTDDAPTVVFVPGTGAGATSPVALTDAATIDTDATRGSLFTVTLGGDRLLANPTGLTEGQRVVWRLTQDATGNRTITLGSMFNVNALVTGSITLSTEPGAVDYLAGVYRSASTQIDVLAFGRGY